MAIKSTNRRPIQLAAGSSKTLNVPAYKQEQSNWDWAACYQMVFKYRSTTISQCSIAQQVPWQTYKNCCGKPSCCNKTASSSDISSGWDHWSYTYNFSSSSISYLSIQSAINSYEVVQALLTWNAGGDHVVLVIGYNTSGGNYIHVNDPSNASTTVMTYGHLTTGYGVGRWNATWNNIY